MNCVPDGVAAAFIGGLLFGLGFALLAMWLESKLLGDKQ